MSSPRAAHTATLLEDGRVLVAGGCTLESCEPGPASRTAELFDPRANRFVAAGRLTAERVGHAAVRLADGRVLLVGGWTGGRVTASTEVYDPRTGAFAATGPMTAPRGAPTVTLLPSGRVLVAGGVGGNGRPTASAELYDPAAGRFAATGAMDVPRTAHAAALLPGGRVRVVGGSNAGPVLGSAEVYDPAAGRFVPTGGLGTARHKHAALGLPSGRVLVVAGSDERDGRGRFSSLEAYDPRTGRFETAGSLGSPRFKLPDAAVLLPGGRVLVAGGAARVEVYDPGSRRSQAAEGSLGADWSFMTATALPDGRVLLAGGYDARIRLTGGAWLYRP